MLYYGSDRVGQRTLHKYKPSTCLGTALPVFIMPKVRLFSTAASVKPSTLSPQAPLSSEENVMARIPPSTCFFLKRAGQWEKELKLNKTNKKPDYFKDGQLSLVE